jgi:hypothetical protein
MNMKLRAQRNIWKPSINPFEGSIKHRSGIWYCALFMKFNSKLKLILRMKLLKVVLWIWKFKIKVKMCRLTFLDRYKGLKMKLKMRIVILT